MKIRVASVVLAVMFVSSPAFAQGRPGPPANPQQLAEQVAALAARLDKLEGKITAADLAGTYTLTGLDGVMSGFVPGAPAHNATIQTVAFTGTVTLNADGTGSFNPVACDGAELTQGSWTLTPVNCIDAPESATWTYADGTVTLKTEEEQDGFTLSVALGGRLLVTAFGAFHAQDPSSDSVLMILTRLR